MSKVDKSGQPNYHKFDFLSNKDLETLLDAYFAAPDAEQIDVDAMLYISGLLAERASEAEKASQDDIAAAKARFYEHYYPLVGDEKSLYDFDDQQKADKPWDFKRFLSFSKILWHRFASFTAVLFILMFGVTITASALGHNPVKALGQWDDGQFWFEPAPVTAELSNKLAEYGYTIGIVPKWLPKGYQFEEITVTEYDSFISVVAEFYKKINNATDKLYIDYRIYLVNKKQPLFEKDKENVTEHQANGINHYIMQNLDMQAIVWRNGNYDGSIYGNFSLEEAKKIINSIYEE